MKRASLTIPPKTQKRDAPDLTDRLLERDSALKAEKMPRAKPTPKKRETPRARAPRAEPLPPPVSPSPKPIDELADALQQSQAALEALQRAALAEPSRYDLAVRYRLDALAHHLRQVSEFVHASKRGGQDV